MPPDQLDGLSGPSKRRRRARSLSMMSSREVIDVSDSSEPGVSGSRKHDRHEKDPQVEGPNKRHKQNRGSEPPMRKDATITPKAKQKKSRKKIDHHKAPRVSNHQIIKEENKSLQFELKNARQAHEDDNREHQANLDWYAKELKDLQEICDAEAGKVREKDQVLEARHQQIETLKRKLDDTANDLGALQLSCQEKDEELKFKEEAIIANQKELDASKRRSAFFEKSLGTTELGLKAKDEIIAATQKELNDSRQQSALLKDSLTKEKLTVKSQDEMITGLHKELDDSKRQCASLEKSLATTRLELKAKDQVIAANKKELEDSRQRSSSLEKSLGEKERAIKAAKREQSDCRTELASRDEKLRTTELKLDQTNAALDKSEKEKESLHVINEGNGYRNHSIRLREKETKDALQALKTEYKDKTSEFKAENAELQIRCTELQADLEAKEDEQNQMITKFQQKLKAGLQQSQRYNYKEPDEKIKKDFANLESSIRQFVDKLARPVLGVTDEELEIVWPNWSPELRNFLASPLLCNLVLEANVWECVVARIFTAGSKIWAGDLGQSMEESLRKAAGEIEQVGITSDLWIDFQYLRSIASSFVGSLNCADFRPKYFDSDVKTMISTLTKLCGSDRVDQSMISDAMSIFEDARDFQIRLRMLKASYTLRMYKSLPGRQKLKYGFQFADEEMDDRSPSRGHNISEQAPSVDFIMYPGLYKRGSNDGANYETKTCVVKMGVVCNAQDLSRKLKRSASAQSSSTRAQKAIIAGEAKQDNEDSTSQSRLGSTADKPKKGTSYSNPLHIQSEEADLQDFDPLSTPGLTSGSLEPRAHDAAQMQSGRATDKRTRSRRPPKPDNNGHDGKSSIKSKNNHLYPNGPASGRGGGSSGKKKRNSKQSDPDADYNSESTV